MRSPAEPRPTDAAGGAVAPARRAAEHLLRAAAVAALAVAAWRRLQPAPEPLARPEVASAAALAGALPRWTAAPPDRVPAVHAALDALPGDTARAWLAALAAAGTRVTWAATRAPALAAESEPVADPTGGVRVRAASLADAPLAVADALGPLDSLARAGEATALLLADAAGGLTVRAPGAVARLAAPPALRLGEVVLLARAGWEGRFVAAALEERGWTVRARFAVAPAVTVGALAPGTGAASTADSTPPRAAPLALDTARVAAVVVLDSSAAPLAPALAAWVRRGGGLVLAGDAPLAAGLRPLAPALPGAPVADSLRGATRPLGSLRPDAVPVAWRGSGAGRAVAAAARRVGAGRVLVLGTEETWPVRLAPPGSAVGDDGPATHRAWWAAAVAAVAYAPPRPAAGPPVAAPGEPAAPAPRPAPLAATVAALGPPAARPQNAAGPAAPVRRLPGDALLVGGAVAAVLAEVASRRLRGAR